MTLIKGSASDMRKVIAPKLFEGTAAYYARYRPGYPEEAFDAVVDHLKLGDESYVLDLGCGTGQIAIPLARRKIPVRAVDPDTDMLCEGMHAEERAEVLGICWQRGDDSRVEQLSLPRLSACLMGASFHWMDRDSLLKKLDRLIIDSGGVAILSGGTSVWSGPGDGWPAVAKQVVIDFLGAERRAAGGTYTHPDERHEVILRRSVFSNVQEFTFNQAQEIGIDEIIGLQLSTSYASPAQLGDRIDEFKDTLRQRLHQINSSGVFHGSFTSQVLIGKRS